MRFVIEIPDELMTPAASTGAAGAAGSQSSPAVGEALSGGPAPEAARVASVVHAMPPYDALSAGPAEGASLSGTASTVTEGVYNGGAAPSA